MFTIYKSNVLQMEANTRYPFKVEINNKADMQNAFTKDYVCACYKDNRRSNSNFLSSDCLAMDCDNSHSENPDEWVNIDDVKNTFAGVSFGVHYSRNHMKEKGGKAARPKFHVFFPIDTVISFEEYKELKQKVYSVFPFFDNGAMDAGRFFFGTQESVVDFIEGDINLTSFLNEVEAGNFDEHINTSIQEGERNAYLSRFASRVLIKYGDTEEANNAFLECNEKCVPPLEENELRTIWKSALKFYEKIASSPSYVPPSEFNDSKSYKPTDYTDVGQAKILAEHYQKAIRFSASTQFLCFRKNYWEESNIAAHAVVHDLTEKQLSEAEKLMFRALKNMDATGASALVASKGKKAVDFMTDEQKAAYQEYLDAAQYKKFVLGRRESKNITSTLNEVKPMIEIKPSELDSDPFLICTPSGTYDLRIGLESLRPNEASDYITKITAASPSDKGKQMWLDCLNKIFAKNPELIDYVQMVCGLAAIGKVMVEGMIIAYGDGGNGKSTFWNAIFRTLGLYSGKISADTLTTSCKRNTKPEMAEAKGKRLLIASESQQGARLDESMVKQLCSTDEVEAEKKYKDPFHFVPCHTLVLYTNYLPRVSGIDDGIWSRLFVIPFNNKLRGGSGDIKNYADVLFENAGEYIMKWIIEGAKKVIDVNYHLPTPKVVQEAIDEYREQNNWFNHFIEDCCEVDSKSKVSSSALYSAYRKYSAENGEFVRSTTEFYSTLEKNGYKKVVEKRIKYIKGLSLSVSGDVFEDFLT